MPPLPGGRNGEKYLWEALDNMEPQKAFQIWYGSKRFTSIEWVHMHEQLVVFEVPLGAMMGASEALRMKALGL